MCLYRKNKNMAYRGFGTTNAFRHPLGSWNVSYNDGVWEDFCTSSTMIELDQFWQIFYIFLAVVVLFHMNVLTLLNSQEFYEEQMRLYKSLL